ncbi:MAG: hypothetical protein EHM72_11710 [Calditrichaeota bacterium]|nr:MAG: hypothetical protein EHM72_11710 [Calditrichota bacterium]
MIPEMDGPEHNMNSGIPNSWSIPALFYKIQKPSNQKGDDPRHLSGYQIGSRFSYNLPTKKSAFPAFQHQFDPTAAPASLFNSELQNPARHQNMFTSNLK